MFRCHPEFQHPSFVYVTPELIVQLIQMCLHLDYTVTNMRLRRCFSFSLLSRMMWMSGGSFSSALFCLEQPDISAGRCLSWSASGKTKITFLQHKCTIIFLLQSQTSFPVMVQQNCSFTLGLNRNGCFSLWHIKMRPFSLLLLLLLFLVQASLTYKRHADLHDVTMQYHWWIINGVSPASCWAH